jgi:hypothetical protein
MICSRHIIVNILYEGEYDKYDDDGDAKTNGMSELDECTSRCIVYVSEEKGLESRLSTRY